MMASKSKKPAIATEQDKETYPRKAIPLICIKGDSEEVMAGKHAALVTSPELAAFRAIAAVEAKGLGTQIDTPALLEQLRQQSALINSGDMKQAESMLINQATALQSLFSRLTERGMNCDQVASFEANMRMALRAQSQCRATLETLATIKNPPIVYAKQANISNGPQQVNNGQVPQAGNFENQQSKLSGGRYELCENSGTQGIAGGVNPSVEALAAIDRATHSGRQREGIQERL
jgi:hypothetical protein